MKAVPEGYITYEKIRVEGPKTFEQFFEEMKTRYNIEITLVTSGKFSLYNAYLPGNKHAMRRPRFIEEIYSEISE